MAEPSLECVVLKIDAIITELDHLEQFVASAKMSEVSDYLRHSTLGADSSLQLPLRPSALDRSD